MKRLTALSLSIVAATPVLAEGSRQLDAHEHGVGQLNIAFEGKEVAMELHAPGADIVGFEYAAESAEDLAKIDAAVATLTRPLDLFTLPADAACTVVQASAGLESEEEHDAHDDHDKHDDHEDHAAHDDHDHDKADDHADHHDEEASHTEFHAEYLLTCADPSAVTNITFAYFDTFPNALEVEVQLVSNKGATSFEVERDSPVLELGNIF